MEIILSGLKCHQLSSSYCLAEKMFDKQTEKQVIVGAEAEERELGKAFPSFSSPSVYSSLIELDLFPPHKTFLNGKVGICSYNS